jgi:hypothetical protein
MDSSAAQRRLKAIRGHLAANGESHPQLRPNPTAGEFFLGTFSLSLSLSLRVRVAPCYCVFDLRC